MPTLSGRTSPVFCQASTPSERIWKLQRLAFPARLALPGAPPRPDAVDDDSVPLEQLAFAPPHTLALADVALGAVALLLFVAALAAGVWCLADDDAPGDEARKWA